MTDNKFTDEEIVKALEEEIHLAEYVDSDYCCNIEVSLLKSTLDYINRQKAEIDRWKEKSIVDDKLLNDRVQEAITTVSKANQKYVETLEKVFNDRTAELKTAKEEIEKLKNCVNRCKSGKEYWVKCLLENPNEAIKEFAERLCEGKVSNDKTVIEVKALLKEMAGEE